MWQMTILRLVLMLCTGGMLFLILLIVNGRLSTVRLKRRKKSNPERPHISKSIIVKGYMIILSAIVLLSFIIMRYFARGKP